jgi:glucose-1-phosphatase
MSVLKNIIFDLGAVLIDIDYKKTEKAFKQLGYYNFEEMYSQFTANEIFEKLETGKISNEDFYSTMISLNRNEVSPQQVKDAWNAILLGWRKNSVAFLKTVSKKYHIFLLSNTNAIHQEYFFKSLKQEIGLSNFNSFFTKAYYSHEINLRKPNADIFEFIAKDANILPDETLFIDDSHNNIKTARGLGFKTHLLLPTERIEHLDYEQF